MDKSQIIALALNILNTNSCVRDSGIHIPKMKPCNLCEQELITQPDGLIKEFTMVSCGCLFHQKCLEEYLLMKSKEKSIITCPNWECARDIETFISPDLFKDTSSVDFGSQTSMDVDADVLLTNELGMLDEEVQILGQKKRSREVNRGNETDASLASTDKSSCKKAKKSGGKKESDKLKKFIELSSETSRSLEVMKEGTGSFFDLYNAIINTEGQVEIANQDVIKSYYNFGKTLADRYEHYEENNPKRTAQTLVNEEVRKQLPVSVSDDALRKKKERALKIYKLFSEIGEHMIFLYFDNI
jgi:hypothetical protein